MSSRVELFISPGCTKCAHVKTMLKSVMDELGQNEFAWREVDLIEESAYATGLGVSASPSIVIDGQLVFSSAPKAEQLCAELTRRLVYEPQAITDGGRALTVRVEVFSSPGCGKCGQAKEVLRKIAQEMGGGIAWREVNILEELDYAVRLGVMSTPAIAMNGKLLFTALPSATKLRLALEQALREVGAP